MPASKSDAGFLQSAYASPKTPDYVIAEMRYDSRIAVSRSGRFEALESRSADVTRLHDILASFRVARIAPHFDLPATTLAKRITAAPSRAEAKVSAEFAHGGFVQVVPRNPQDCAKLAQRLRRLKTVWQAYVAPRPVPAAVASGTSPASRNFEPSQGYLHSAPNGIGAMHVWGVAGGKGRGVRICDIEGNWNRRHQDLPRRIPLIGGTVINDIGWRNHGTAVLGEMVSRPGLIGTVGIAHQAAARVQSTIIGGVFNTAGAIMNAANHLAAGDVILIELHAIGPNGRYVAMQYWDDIFSAIVAATARGITVVEAAGNGGENFQLPIYNGTGLQRDSGAIVVGAGIPPTNFFDVDGFGAFPGYSEIGVPRSRIWFSNYGRIVNVQGWGWHVTTLGYGDAQGGASENRWYTLRFSGTSSASPIVTGAVACVQGRAKAKLGHPLTPGRVRRLLIRTGTPQVPGPGVPLSQHIGPLPNLARAFRRI
jgi:Subtilase family